MLWLNLERKSRKRVKRFILLVGWKPIGSDLQTPPPQKKKLFNHHRSGSEGPKMLGIG